MTSIGILLAGAGTPSCSLSLWGCLLTGGKCFLEKWSASRTVLPKVPSDQYSLKGTVWLTCYQRTPSSSLDQNSLERSPSQPTFTRGGSTRLSTDRLASLWRKVLLPEPDIALGDVYRPANSFQSQINQKHNRGGRYLSFLKLMNKWISYSLFIDSEV